MIQPLKLPNQLEKLLVSADTMLNDIREMHEDFLLHIQEFSLGPPCMYFQQYSSATSYINPNLISNSL